MELEDIVHNICNSYPLCGKCPLLDPSASGNARYLCNSIKDDVVFEIPSERNLAYNKLIAVLTKLNYNLTPVEFSDAELDSIFEGG